MFRGVIEDRDTGSFLDVREGSTEPVPAVVGIATRGNTLLNTGKPSPIGALFRHDKYRSQSPESQNLDARDTDLQPLQCQ